MISKVIGLGIMDFNLPYVLSVSSYTPSLRLSRAGFIWRTDLIRNMVEFQRAAGLNICNQLSVLTLLSCIGVIPENDTLSPHPLLIMGCLVNSGAIWPALLKQKLQLINVVFKFYKKYKYILLLTYSTKVMKITWIASAICSTSALATLTARFRRWSMDSRPMSIFLLSSGTAFNILAVLSVTDTKPGGRPLQSWDGSNNLKCKSIS